MPQKYKITAVNRSADKLFDSYWFNANRLHREWGCTRDGRFYSKAAAVDCLNECYLHYKQRFEYALSDDNPIFDGQFLIVGRAIWRVSKA